MLTVRQQTSRVLYLKLRPPNYGGAACRSAVSLMVAFLAGWQCAVLRGSFIPVKTREWLIILEHRIPRLVLKPPDFLKGEFGDGQP